MKKTSLLFILAIAFILLSNSCIDKEHECVFGSGEELSQVISLSAFEGIELDIAAKVFLKKGTFQKVEILAQKNIANHIDKTVRDGIWRIHFDHCIMHHDDIEVFITLPSINHVEVNSSGSVFTSDIFNEEVLNILSKGSGDIRFDIEAEKLSTNISGSGTVQLHGNVNTNEVEISGSGDLEAFECKTAIIDFHLRGSGDAFLFAEDELNGNISGSGSVYFKGDPLIDVVKAGSGDLIDVN